MKESGFNRENSGKLFMRLVLGPILTAKGVVFFVKGKTSLIAIGGILSAIGITFWPLVFGWIIAAVCVVCGVTFAIGAFFKTSAFFLGTFTLFEAIFRHFSGANLMDNVAYALMLSAVLYGFIFVGPGTYVVQKQ
jgi:putative oxidoreductase